MFIKLTRLDGTPIWINASFVVTVEPRKAGGSVVVPIGDGLDYDVKETPDVVLGMLGAAPMPAVVPVPAPPGLAPTPADVSPEAEPAPADEPGPAPVTAPAKKPGRSRAKARADAPKTEEPAAEPEDGLETAAKKPRARRTTKKPMLALTEEEVARLRKLAPGSVRKLQNTLAAQFRTVEPEATVAALEAHGFLAIDRDRIAWK